LERLPPPPLTTRTYFLLVTAGASMVDGLPDIWKKFPPQHPLIIHVVALIYILLWIVNTVGNWLVIYIFVPTKSLRTPVRKLPSSRSGSH
jgi:hypothetical protein